MKTWLRKQLAFFLGTADTPCFDFWDQGGWSKDAPPFCGDDQERTRLRIAWNRYNTTVTATILAFLIGATVFFGTLNSYLPRPTPPAEMQALLGQR